MLNYRLKVMTVGLVLLSVTVLLGGSPVLADTPAVVPPAGAATSTLASSAVITTTNTVTPTVVVTPTATKVPPTATKVPPTATSKPSNTPVVKATTAVTPTATKVAPTATKVPPTATKLPPTATKPAPTATTAARAARAAAVTSLSTVFYVQNIGTGADASITAQLMNTGGTVQNSVARTVAQYKHGVIDQRAADGGLNGLTSWSGAAVLSSSEPAAAVVLQYGGSSASGADFRMDAYNGSSSGDAATSVLLPQVLKNFVSYNSSIAIQNTSASNTANVSIEYTNILLNPAGVSTHDNISIPPGASAIIEMASEVSQWTTFFGPARITSSEDVAVVVNRSKAGVLITYRGLTSADAGSTLIVPQALTNFSTLQWFAAVEGMTVNGNSSTYSVTYKNLLNGQQKTCSLPEGSTFRIDFRSGGWPAGCTPPVGANVQFFGQVVIEGSTPLVALVNQATGNVALGTRALTVPAFPSTGGTTTGYAPLIMNNYLDTGTNIRWGTGIEGRMAGTGTVQIQYYLSNGQTYSDSYVVGSDQIFRFDQRTGNPLPSGSIGAARITAPSPILFRINYSADGSALGDGAGAHWGINQ